MKREEPLQVQWIKHTGAVNNEIGSDPKDIIENISLSAAEGIRGDLTGKEYEMPAAIKMNEKYDKLAAAGYFRKDPHINSLSATDAVIAAKTGKDAAAYHKQKPSLIKNWQELRAKRNKILNDIKIEKRRGDYLKERWGLKKKENDGVKYVGSRQHLLEDLPIIKNNINNKKRNTFDEYVKTNKLPTLTEKETKALRGNKKVRDYMLRNYKPIKVASKPKPNGHDTQPNVIPIGPIPHEKPWYGDDEDDAAYRFKFPEREKYTVLDKIKLRADLEKAVDANSGIGQFDKRRRLSSGGNGSTSKWEKDHPFTKRVEEIYNIQLSGNETLDELLEIIRGLPENKAGGGLAGMLGENE